MNDARSFLVKNHHWVVLGISLAIACSIGVLVLIPWMMGQGDLPFPQRDSKSTGNEQAFSSFTSAKNALSLIQNTPVWKTREDGASPLVSRPYLLRDGSLLDPEEAEQLHPPVPNKWLIDHHYDYSDLDILNRQSKFRGFTVLEEYQSDTDPGNPEKLPPLLCTKLHYSEEDIHKSSYTFEFTGVVDNPQAGGREFELRPSQPLPNPERKDRKDTSTRRARIGESVPGAPLLKVVDYQENKRTVNDTEYDTSQLMLENTLNGERYTLEKKSISRDYAKRPIEISEGVTFHYLLTGIAEQKVEVKRGDSFDLRSLDSETVETYKLKGFSSDGILLEKGEKTIVLHPDRPVAAIEQ